MQKMYKMCAVILCCCILNVSLFAQTCDTVKYKEALSGGWSDTSYPFVNFFGGLSGYVNGVTDENPSQVANAFDLTGSSYSYILGVMVKFGAANTNVPDSLDRTMIFKVYSDDGGKPGTLLVTSQPKTMRQIKADVDAGAITKIDFPATALPASKKFYVSVDISKFMWEGSPTSVFDTLWIAGTEDDEIAGNTAWKATGNNKWFPFSDIYSNPNDNNNDLNVNLWIFPYVSVNTAGCGVLPVNLLSFTAARNSNDVVLNWEVSNEVNMKGYEVEKADNNVNFRSISFSPASNNLKNQRYSITDRNAFSTASSVQFRLKQVNADGSAVYSGIISLKHGSALTDVVFQNPVHNALNLQLSLATPEKVDLKIYDAQGRVVAAKPAQTYASGTNSIEFSNIAHLAPGTYYLKLTSGTEQSLYKVVKQ